MRRLLIPLTIAGAMAIVVLIFLREDEDPDRRGSFGRDSSGNEASDGTTAGDRSREFDPIAPERPDLPPNELLIDPPPIDVPDEDDASVSLTALPGATWVEIEDWFSDRATHEERMQTSREILTQLPREEALDRLLTLAGVVSESRGRADFCFALGDLLVPTVLDSPTELTRFRRILTKGKNPSERFVALPIIQKAVEVSGETKGVIEAYELAFFSVVDGEFAQALMGEVGPVQSPTRAMRLVHESIQRGKNIPGNGYYLAAVNGAYSILEAEKVARRKIESRELPPGHALIREYRLADRVDLRASVIDQVFEGALDGRRTEEEFLAALEFLRVHAPRRVSELREACSQPELRRLGS